MVNESTRHFIVAETNKDPTDFAEQTRMRGSVGVRELYRGPDREVSP